MKSHLSTILFIALVAGLLGGTFGRVFLSVPASIDEVPPQVYTDIDHPVQMYPAADDFTPEIVQMQDRISSLEAQLNQLAREQSAEPANSDDTVQQVAVAAVPQQPAAASDLEYLAAAGVDSEAAGEILRQISWQQFRNMELRNLMRSADPSDRRLYAQELRELNQSRVSLRTELGDDVYDKYLFVSGKNNRVKVNVVMAGSPAETNGVQPGDVILHYNDTRIIEARDLQQAAQESNAGYANIEILRDGNLMNLMLPEGTMGVQLQPMRLDPGQ